MEAKGFFQFEIIINVFVSSFRFILIPMLWVYGHCKYFNFFSAGPGYRFYASETDVYRRQILTDKDGRRTERVKLIHSSFVSFLRNGKSSNIYTNNYHPWLRNHIHMAWYGHSVEVNQMQYI